MDPATCGGVEELAHILIPGHLLGVEAHKATVSLVASVAQHPLPSVDGLLGRLDLRTVDALDGVVVSLGLADGVTGTLRFLRCLLEACSVTHRLTPRLAVLREPLGVLRVPSSSATFLDAALLVGKQHLGLTDLVVHLLELLVPVVVLGVVLVVLVAARLEPVLDAVIGDLLAFELATVQPRVEDVAVTGALVLLKQRDDGGT